MNKKKIVIFFVTALLFLFYPYNRVIGLLIEVFTADYTSFFTRSMAVLSFLQVVFLHFLIIFFLNQLLKKGESKKND